MPEPSDFKVELAIEKLKSHKSPGIDQIPAELIKAGVRTIRCAIHKLIISIWNKEELPEKLCIKVGKWDKSILWCTVEKNIKKYEDFFFFGKNMKWIQWPR